jgi:hypothetical protein
MLTVLVPIFMHEHNRMGAWGLERISSTSATIPAMLIVVCDNLGGLGDGCNLIRAERFIKQRQSGEIKGESSAEFFPVCKFMFTGLDFPPLFLVYSPRMYAVSQAGHSQGIILFGNPASSGNPT